MTRPSARLLIALLGVAVLVALWWASGLDRRPADPRRYFTEAQIVRARAYQGPNRIAYLISLVLGLATLALFAFTPIGDRLLAPVRRWPWALAGIGAVVLVLVTRAAIRLPVAFWRGYLREHTYGFSTQSPAGWFGDWAKGLGINLALTALVFVGFLWLVRALPRGWPPAAAGGAAVLVLALSFLGPVLFEPVFNRFSPLEDRAFAGELMTLAERAGVPVREVLVADASRRTTKENAYVSGFGGTRRLVLYDTLLERASRDEVVLVVAHELGHRRLRHVEVGTLVGALTAAASVGVLWLLMRSPAVLRAARADGPADPRVLPLLLLAITLLTLAIQPMSLWLSRRYEREADRFSLELTQQREVYVETERGLSLRNLGDLDPGQVVYRFLFTHPAPAERIAMAGEA